MARFADPDGVVDPIRPISTFWLDMMHAQMILGATDGAPVRLCFTDLFFDQVRKFATRALFHRD